MDYSILKSTHSLPSLPPDPWWKYLNCFSASTRSSREWRISRVMANMRGTVGTSSSRPLRRIGLDLPLGWTDDSLIVEPLGCSAVILLLVILCVAFCYKILPSSRTALWSKDLFSGFPLIKQILQISLFQHQFYRYCRKKRKRKPLIPAQRTKRWRKRRFHRENPLFWIFCGWQSILQHLRSRRAYSKQCGSAYTVCLYLKFLT